MEEKEIDLILGNGTRIKSGDRELTVQKMNLGRILTISKVAVTIDIDEDSLQSQDLSAVTRTQFNTVVENAEKCAEIIAIATVQNYRNNKEIGAETVLIMDEMTPEELLAASVAIIKTADLGNFMTSTFLMNGANRPTQATRVEE